MSSKSREETKSQTNREFHQKSGSCVSPLVSSLAMNALMSGL